MTLSMGLVYSPWVRGSKEKMIEPGQIRPCSKCKSSFQPKPYQIKSGNYLCRECTNEAQREYLQRRKKKNEPLAAEHVERSMIGDEKAESPKSIQIPNIELPSDRETKAVREVLAKYGLEIDDAALVAARAVKAGFPVKNLAGYMGKDYLLFCVMSDMMNVKHAQIRMRYLEMAGQLTGALQAGQPGGMNIMKVEFNELGIKPGGGALSGKKAGAVMEAETVKEGV